MRLILLFAVACGVFAQNAREIVSRSLDTGDANDRIARNYTYLRHMKEVRLDAHGAAKTVKQTTEDVTMLEGTPYRRLVERDGKPLPPKEAEKERHRLEKSIADRRRETPTQRDARMADYQRRRDRERATTREILDAYDFRIADETPEYWRVEGVPHPGYQPKSKDARYFAHFRGSLTIDKRDYGWRHVEVEAIDSISMGLFLVKLDKGARVTIETRHVNGEVWMPERVRADVSARVALVKSLRIQQEFTYTDFHKFQSESRIVQVTQ